VAAAAVHRCVVRDEKPIPLAVIPGRATRRGLESRYSNVIARSAATKQSIFPRMRLHGLLRFARNDGVSFGARRTKIDRRANQKNLSSPSRKNISLPPSGNQRHSSARLTHTRGVAHVTKRAVGCGGRRSALRRTALRRTAKSCGSDAPMLASSFAVRPARRRGNKAGHRERRAISRKPLRGKAGIASAEPVCSCAFSFVQLAHETAGAAAHPVFPAPSDLEGPKFTQSSGATRRENVKLYSAVIARSEATKQSIYLHVELWIASLRSQ